MELVVLLGGWRGGILLLLDFDGFWSSDFDFGRRGWICGCGGMLLGGNDGHIISECWVCSSASSC